MNNLSFIRNGKKFEPTKNELKIVLDDYAKQISELQQKLAEKENKIEEMELNYLCSEKNYLAAKEQLMNQPQEIVKKIKEKLTNHCDFLDVDRGWGILEYNMKYLLDEFLNDYEGKCNVKDQR